MENAEIPDSVKVASSSKSDLIRKDKKAIKLSILYEFLQGTPTLKAFGNFCNAVGNDVMEYLEFDYWYHQIGVECADLNEDINWNPNSKTLFDMPLRIIDKVLDDVKPIDRLVVRKVSQNLRSITKAREHGYKEVSLEVGPTSASIQLDRGRWPDCDEIKYISLDDGSCNVVFGEKSNRIAENREPVDELVNLEQWKKAIDIETNTVSEIHLQIDHVMHSKRFEITKETFSEEEAIQIRDVLTKSALFEEGLLKLPDYDYEAIGKVFDPAYVHTGPNSILYSSNDVQFAIVCDEDRFSIKRADVEYQCYRPNN